MDIIDNNDSQRDLTKLVTKTNSNVMKLIPLVAAMALAGCGGGGGGGSDVVPPEAGPTVTDSGSSDDNGNSGNGGDSNAAKFGTAKLTLADGTEANTFDAKGGVFEVQLLDASGKAANGEIVTFSSNNASVVFANGNGTRLTDKDGKASLAFSSNDPAIDAAVALTANASIGDQSVSVTKKAQFKGEEVVSTADPKIATSQILVDNKPTSTISASGGSFKVTVVNGKGEPLEDQIVNFAANSGEIVFGNTSKSVLTDENGIAQLSFKPSNTNLSGAFTLTASTNVDGTAISSSENISVQSTAIELSTLTLGQTNLPSAGQTSVKVRTLNSSTKEAVNGITVNFSPDCGVITPAALASSGNGEVTVSYSAVKEDGSLCAGPVNITASGGLNSSLTQQVTVAAAKPTQIEYPEGQSSVIGIKNSGSSSQATIKFVVYSDGTPLSGESVTFNLSKAPKGVVIGQLSNTEKTYTVISNAKGEVPLNIYPGGTPGPVEVKATVDRDTNISALSKGISIANARASQAGISLSRTSNIIQGWDRDGESSTYTMRVADSQGNPVPDGTVVNFTAEGGQIQQSCETKKVNKVSLCSVNFISQNPKPKDGRITIMAVIEGEKSYVDTNQSNSFDEGETITTNIGNTFRDDNENGKYDEGELIYLREGDSAGTEACGSPAIENQPNIAKTCNKKIDALLRSQSIMLFASDTPVLSNFEGTKTGFSFTMHTVGPTDATGKPNNPMPRETTISAAVKAVEGSECKVQFQSGYKEIPSILTTYFIGTAPRNNKGGNVGDVPNLGTDHGFRFTACVPGDAAEVTIAPPNAQPTAYLFSYDGQKWAPAVD